MKEGKIRVIVHGLGVSGSLGVKMMAAKKGIEIVGAVAHRKEKAGRDLGDVVGLGRKLGITVTNDIDAVFSETVADVVLDTTCSYMRELYPALTKALKAKINFISIGEELSYPWVSAPELAFSIDKLAKENGVTVLGTGLNPGFALDAMPIFLSGVAGNLQRIRVRRVVDISGAARSHTVMTHFGIGLTPEEYKKKEQEGMIASFVGLSGCVAMIADTIGWKVEITEMKEPLIAKVRREISGNVVEVGQVYGARHVARGSVDGEEVIIIELILGCSFDFETEGLEVGMRYWLEGEPNIEVNFVSGITSSEEAQIVTMARAINAIPYVVNASPGLLSVHEVGLISYLS